MKPKDVTTQMKAPSEYFLMVFILLLNRVHVFTNGKHIGSLMCPKMCKKCMFMHLAYRLITIDKISMTKES